MPYGKVATDDEWVSGVCPSVRLCVAFTTPTRPDRPKEPALFTFDPRTFATGPRTTISVGALHCVSASQCTLVTSETSQSGNSVALTFDPAAPATQRRVVLPASVEAGQLDCPTTHQCTTVGVDVSDRTALRYVAVTFAPGGAVLPPVDLGPRKTVWPPLNVSCPTAGQCTVGGANKRTLTTFNPRRPEARRIHRFLSDKRLGDDSYLGFVSCPSAKLCVAGGADPEQHGFDLEGEALLVAFDPRTGRAPRFP
jgi:hypothetical protein